MTGEREPDKDLGAAAKYPVGSRDSGAGKRAGTGTDKGTADRWRLSLFHLVGLAAGGVIGSGWISAAAQVDSSAGSKSWLVWLVGGLLMLVIAWVMVELGRDAPKTGGLIFLPLQSSGPLVATVVAAGLWIFYDINLVAESTMMTSGLSPRLHLFRTAPGASLTHTLTGVGWATVLPCMVAISALNLLLPRIFFRINSWLTVVKIGIIVAAVVLLLGHFSFSPPPSAASAANPVVHSGWTTAFTSVVTGGVIYAYVGFQGPLDFAGNIRRSAARWLPGRPRRPADDGPDTERAREAGRLRWAVLGTLIGSVLLYGALQMVYERYRGYVHTDSPVPPFTQIALHGGAPALVWALRIGGVLAPMGAGLVFAHTLTREVAALGRSHLTHRGLQTGRRTTLGKQEGIYWLVLLVDLCLGVVILGLVRGNWNTLVSVTGVLALTIYAMPGVVLVALENRFATRSPRRRAVQNVLARVSFALIGLVLYMTGWPDMWRAMVAIAAGCALLLGLPLVSTRWPGFGRFYDAKPHALLLGRWRQEAAARTALVLVGYLAALTLLTLWGNMSPAAPCAPAPSVPGTSCHASAHRTRTVVLGGATVLAALIAFQGLVVTSRQYLAESDKP